MVFMEQKEILTTKVADIFLGFPITDVERIVEIEEKDQNNAHLKYGNGFIIMKNIRKMFELKEQDSNEKKVAVILRTISGLKAFVLDTVVDCKTVSITPFIDRSYLSKYIAEVSIDESKEEKKIILITDAYRIDK